MTDIGMVRRENQDAYRLREDLPGGYTVCVVCDGMGGPAGGQRASRIAVETYLAELEKLLHPGMDPRGVRKVSAWAVALANRAIREEAEQHADYGHMGTTLVSAILCQETAVITNVGDSRAYYISQNGIARITRDHSVVQNMVERGEITAEEARRHPKRNLITRALGPDEVVECDAYLRRMEPDSCLLLCTDGLTNTVSDQEILFEVLHGGETDHCLDRLLAVAKSRGAPDNVTAVLMQWA